MKHVLPRRLNHRGRISDFRFKKLFFQSIGQNYLQRQSLAKSDADVDLSDFRKRVDDVSDFDDDDSSRYDVKDAAKNDVGNGRGGRKEMKKKKRKKQGGEFLLLRFDFLRRAIPYFFPCFCLILQMVVNMDYFGGI